MSWPSPSSITRPGFAVRSFASGHPTLTAAACHAHPGHRACTATQSARMWLVPPSQTSTPAPSPGAVVLMARGQVELLYVFQVRTHCTGRIVITSSQPRPTAPLPVPANLNAARSGAQVPAGCAPHSTWWAVCTLDLGHLARACACVIEFARGLTQSCISRCICRYRISFRLLQVRHRQDTPDPVLYCTCTLSYADSSSIDQPPLHMDRARPMPTPSPTSLPREARARASERGRCVMPAASLNAHICDGEHVPACRGCAGGSQSIQIDFCDLQGSDDASAPATDTR